MNVVTVALKRMIRRVPRRLGSAQSGNPMKRLPTANFNTENQSQPSAQTEPDYLVLEEGVSDLLDACSIGDQSQL